MQLRTLSSRLVVLLTALMLVGASAPLAAADTITLMWDANPEPQVAGYVLHVGTQPGIYTQHTDVGLATSVAFPSAVAGQRYCFAVSAYFAGPLEGTKSGEVCGFSNEAPSLVNPGSRVGTLAQAISLQLQGSDPDGQPLTYSVTGLPAGLTLMASTGYIAGTPTSAGTFSVTATVSDGTLTASQSFSWTISAPDSTVPTVSITGPTSAATYAATAATMTLSGTAADNVGVSQVSWVNNRGGSGNATGTTSWSAASITLQAGANTLTVTARDAAGNVATDVVTVTYNQAPTLAAVSNQSTVIGQTVSLQLAGSDANGDALTYSATGLPAGLSIAASTGRITGVPTTAGAYSVTASVSDAALSASRTFTWTILVAGDTTPPSVAMSAPAAGSTVSGTVTVSATASDASGVAGVQFRLDGANLGAEDVAAPFSISWNTTTASAGSHALTAVARDAAGNTATSTVLTITVNNAPPPGGDGTSNLVGHWRLDDGTGTTAGDSAGTHPGTLRNGAAWTPGRVGQAIRLDGVDDYVDLGILDVAGSALTMAAWIRPDGFLTDDGRILSKSTGTAEQDHFFMLSTVDSGGYKLRFRLKAGGSTTTLVASSGALSTGQWVHAAAVYNGSAMILYLNGTEVGRVAKTGALTTGATVPVAIGRNPIAYGAFTGALDDVRLYSRALTVGDIQALIAGDSTAPTVAISGPTSAATHATTAATVSLNGTASDAVGVTQVSWTSDRGGSGTATGTTSWSTGAIALQPGLNTLTVTARDAAGNVASDVLVVTYNGAPTFTAAGNKSSSIGLPATLQLSASDPNGDVLTYSATGLCAGLTLNASTGLISGTPTYVGTYSVTATVSDGALSASQTFTWTVTPDTTAPALTITAPTTAATHAVTTATVAVSGTASDGVGVTQVSWVNNRGGSGTAAGTATWSVASIALLSGQNIITVTARDAAGNTSTDVLTVTRNTAPALAAVANMSTEVGKAGSVQLSGSDADGDVLTYGANGLPPGTALTVSTGLVSGAPTAAGTYTVTATVFDASQSASRTFTWTVTADVTAPAVTIAAPTTATTYTSTANTVTLSGTASDLLGVTQVSWVNSRGGNGVATGTAAWSAAAIALQGGSNTLTVTARDAAGNTASDVLTVTYAAPPSGDTTSNLVAHWRLDEGTGTTALDAVGARAGTLRNGPAWTAGRQGQAVRFDGADDYVDLGSFDVSGSALTIATWIRPDGFPVDDGRIVSKATGTAEQDHYFMLSTVASGGGYRLRFRLKTGATTSTLIATSGTLAVGQWAHVAAVYNGSAMILYLNGTEVGRVAKTGALATNASVPVAIGRNPQAYGAFMGAVDDVRLYQRSLSVADIQALAGN
jgi:PKD repeat protein